MSIAIPPKLANTHGVLCVDTLSKDACNKIINLHKVSHHLKGRVQEPISKGADYRKIVSIRQVDCWVIDESHEWIDQLLVDKAVRANETFDYNMAGLLERPQLLRYNAPSIGYDWHTDIGSGDASTRKISCSILLNDEFKGGDLEFFSSGIQKIEMNKGDVVCFSSFMPHRVTRVEKGFRWALVCWFSGSPFK